MSIQRNNIMSVQINKTIVRFNAKAVPALGIFIGAEKYNYSNRKTTDISAMILCFLFELEIITPKK